MENYILYEELSKSDQQTVYKGRKKGTIHFLTIHCVDKAKRHEITNHVRLCHELEHRNLVRFHEWYETGNHLWMVVELCTGPSLHDVIQQDRHLPESTVRKFGIDIVTALRHVHSQGVMVSDLSPRKWMLDGQGDGIIKLADLSFAKIEGEDLLNLYEQMSDSSDKTLVDELKKKKFIGNIHYTAPEVIRGADFSIASDLWGLGCLLYHMFSGHPPFLADDEAQLEQKILHSELPIPSVKGARVNTKPSFEFQDLLKGLLQKEFDQRLTWADLIRHRFWGNALNGLLDTLSEGSTISELTLQVAGYSLSKEEGFDGDQVEESFNSSKASTLSSSTASHPMELLRPKTAPDRPDSNVAFSLSCRPQTSPSPMSGRQRMPKVIAEEQLEELLFYPNETVISPIVDNPKISKPGSSKFDLKGVPVQPLKGEAFQSPDAVRAHAVALKEQLTNIIQAKSASGLRPRVQLLVYMANCCVHQQVVDAFWAQGVHIALATMLKNGPVDIKVKVARVIGLMCQKCTRIPESSDVSEFLVVLTETIRAAVKDAMLQQSLLSALGDMLSGIAFQEEQYTEYRWTVPSATYVIIVKCLKENNDNCLSHIAAKIIENLAGTRTAHASKFIQTEVLLALWHLFTHSPQDTTRVTAITAIVRLAHQQVAVWESLLANVGLDVALECLSTTVPRIQQALIVLFVWIFLRGKNKPHNVKDILMRFLKILDSPSVASRGKAFLAVAVAINAQSDLLLFCCQNKLVNYVDRDSRKPANSTPDHDYLQQCLDVLIDQIAASVPKITESLLLSLQSIHGRHNPSIVQVKQLKSDVPLHAVLVHVLECNVFVRRLVNDSFIKHAAQLLDMLVAVEQGALNLDAACGAGTNQEFVSNCLNFAESVLTTDVELVGRVGKVVLATLFRPVCRLVESSNLETKIQALKMLTKVSENVGDNDALIAAITANILDILPLFEQLLFEREPVPSVTLRLLHNLILLTPECVAKVQELLLPAIFKLIEESGASMPSRVVLSMMGIVNAVLTSKHALWDQLFEQGMVAKLVILARRNMGFVLTSQMEANSVLPALETINTILKHVSKVVRAALQDRKQTSDAMSSKAEQLLLQNKPMADLIGDLILLLRSDDGDLAEEACSCLSLLVQLFGGEHAPTITPEHVASLATSLDQSEAKRQKVLLRIIKRLCTTNRSYLDALRQTEGPLAVHLQKLQKTANSCADFNLVSLADEILRLLRPS